MIAQRWIVGAYDMRIGFLLSTKGGSPLIGGLERGLAELGHEVYVYQPGRPYDLIIIANQTAHDSDYLYPEFPNPHIPIAFVDSAEYGWVTRFPDKQSMYWNSFTPQAMNHDTKNLHEQTRLKNYLAGRSFPYFYRELLKSHVYPPNYHPIDYPLYHLSHCAKVPDREEYIRRDLDLFVSWGASHPWRLPITEALRGANVKAEISVIEQDGHVRIPQAHYFGRTEAAKCSVSYDGYGSGSFRMTEVLVRTLLLQGPLQIVTRAPLVDGVTCIEYQVESDGEMFLGANIQDKLRAALLDPEGSYEVYRNGYTWCTEQLTERATAQYLIDTVHSHDWNLETVI